MTCPTPSESDIQSLISQVNTLVADVTNTQSCDSECQKKQVLDNLKTNLEKSVDNYSTCEAQYKGDEKAYIVQKYGITYYNEQESKKKEEALQGEKQVLIDLFMEKLTETNNNFDVLQNDVNNFNLMKEMYDNTGINKSLSDIFGITISPFEKEGFDTKSTLETINQEIKFSFEKNKTGKFINKILYIIFYILAVLAIIYMFMTSMFDIKIISLISIIILVLPLLSIIKFIVYLFTILKSLI